MIIEISKDLDLKPGTKLIFTEIKYARKIQRHK